jgi:hypothetical protein
MYFDIVQIEKNLLSAEGKSAKPDDFASSAGGKICKNFCFRDSRRSNKLIIHRASLIDSSMQIERGIDAHVNRFRQSRQNHSAARIYTRIKCKKRCEHWRLLAI